MLCAFYSLPVPLEMGDYWPFFQTWAREFLMCLPMPWQWIVTVMTPNESHFPISVPLSSLPCWLKLLPYDLLWPLGHDASLKSACTLGLMLSCHCGTTMWRSPGHSTGGWDYLELRQAVPAETLLDSYAPSQPASCLQSREWPQVQPTELPDWTQPKFLTPRLFMGKLNLKTVFIKATMFWDGLYSRWFIGWPSDSNLRHLYPA